MEGVLDQVLEAWRTSNRIHLYLIDRISDEGMQATLSKRGGRNVVRQFAHIHNVRFWHLENRARDLSKGLAKYETHDEPGRDELKAALEESGERVAAFLERCVTGEGKHRASKKGAISSLSYFIAHESHHRGNILLTLKVSGHRVESNASLALWDWDKM